MRWNWLKNKLLVTNIDGNEYSITGLEAAIKVELSCAGGETRTPTPCGTRS